MNMEIFEFPSYFFMVGNQQLTLHALAEMGEEKTLPDSYWLNPFVSLQMPFVVRGCGNSFEQSRNPGIAETDKIRLKKLIHSRRVP